MSEPRTEPDGDPVDAPSEGRPRRPRNSLTREAILRTAMEAFRGEDFGALTFQALGRHLGAHPTAIYRHFRDKDDLLLAMLDALHGETLDELGPEQDDWAAELMAIAEHFYAVYRRYPAIAHHMATRTTGREHEFRIVDRILGALRRSGLSEAEAGRHYRPFTDLVLGYTALDASLDALPAQTRASEVAAWTVDYRRSPDDRYPNLLAAAPWLTAPGDPRNFRLAVELHLDAIRARVDAAGAAADGPVPGSR